MISEIESVASLFNLFSEVIPDDTDKQFEVDGYKVSIVKKDGSVEIQLTSVDNEKKEGFDQTEIKKLVENYKAFVNDLDDCLFVEALDEVKEKINIKEFNRLTNLEEYTKEEAELTEKYILYFVKVAKEHISAKLNKLSNIYNRLG